MAEKGILSLGMLHRESNVLMLAVWKNGDEQEAQIDLSKYVGESAQIETVYPMRASDTVSMQGSTLLVNFPTCDSAVWCKISIR